MPQNLAEGQSLSQIEVSGEDCPSAVQGGISPDVQRRALLLVSVYRLSNGHHVVLGLCLEVLSE